MRTLSVRGYGRPAIDQPLRNHRPCLKALPSRPAEVAPGGTAAGLPGGTREVGGDDVGRVPVQAAAGPYRIVVRGSECEAASCTSRSGTPAPLCGGDERMPQRMRSDLLTDPGTTGRRAGRSARRRAGPAAARPWPGTPVPRCVRRWPGRSRCQRDGHDLAALAGHGESPVDALEAQMLDVSAGGLGDPQPVQGEQGDQRVPGRAARARRRRAARRARCGPARPRETRSRHADGARGRRASGLGALLPRRTCRTRRWWTAAG